MLVIFCTEHDFCIISDCKKSFKENKQKFLEPRKKSSSEESLKGKRKTFYCYVFPFHLVQYENTEFMSWHRRIHNLPNI